MAGLFVDAEEVTLAKYQLNYSGGGTNLTLKLFKSNTTPADGHTTANYTEADFLGYVALTLTGASWTITGGAPTIATYPTCTFSSTANQTASLVYGYYMVRGSTLSGAERFTDGPYTIQGISDYIAVVPTIYYKKVGE